MDESKMPLRDLTALPRRSNITARRAPRRAGAATVVIGCALAAGSACSVKDAPPPPTGPAKTTSAGGSGGASACVLLPVSGACLHEYESGARVCFEHLGLNATQLDTAKIICANAKAKWVDKCASVMKWDCYGGCASGFGEKACVIELVTTLFAPPPNADDCKKMAGTCPSGSTFVDY